MTKLQNELPVAVHLASGGDARIRTSGQVIAFDGVSSASLQLTGANRFRGVFSARGTGGLMLLVGYSTPLTLATASWVVGDFGEFSDDVPEGTTVYFSVIGGENMSPIEGGPLDTAHVSFYA